MSYVTIKDIAKQLGVSPSTVSRALRNDKNISPDTKASIVNLANELGYKPNTNAINLRQRKTKIIGIIVPEIITPFFITVINHIQDILYKDGYEIIITQSQESPEKELKNLLLMENSRVEGIIMSICHLNQNEQEYIRLQKRGISIVFFDRVPNIDAPKVVINDYQKSFFLVEHLIRSGRKRIVHLEGPTYLQNSIDRKKGYKDALKKFNYEYDPQLVVHAGVSIEDGEHAITRMVEIDKTNFDAIFCFTDTLAIGAKKVLQTHGFNIPEDVGLAGFSGSLLSTIIQPQLTTVEQPLKEMAQAAVKLLIEEMSYTSPVEYKTIILDAKIQLRASTEINKNLKVYLNNKND